jgi:hypothetical protein
VRFHAREVVAGGGGTAGATSPPVTNKRDVANSERRLVLGALGAIMGAPVLASCVDDVTTVEPEGVAYAVGATPVKWVDSVVGDLRTRDNTGVGSDVVVARGRQTSGDGGGGLFHWVVSMIVVDDGGTIIVPKAGQVATGHWKRIYTGGLDVRWFGGKPNDPSVAAENVTAIHKAIAVARAFDSADGAADRWAGGTVLFAPGTWYISSTINLVHTDSVVLSSFGAAGWAEATGKPHPTKLVMTTVSNGQAIIKLDGCFRCGVRGLMLDGANLATVGIRVDCVAAGSKFNVFEDVQIWNVGIGVWIGSSTVTNSDVVGNVFRRIFMYGIGTGVLQEGGQTVQNPWEDSAIVAFTSYGMKFMGGDITTSSIVFDNNVSMQVADIYVARAASYARFVNNYHETWSGNTYLFEVGARPHFTLFQGVRIKFTSAADKIIDFQQTGNVLLIGCQFDGFDGNDGAVYFRQPSGGSPGFVHEVGCTYLNGARSMPDPVIGSWAATYNQYGTGGPPVLPGYSWDYANPGAAQAICNARLNLHNSVLVLEDNRSGPLYAFRMRSDLGVLKIKTMESRTSGALLSVANDALVKFTLDHQGGPGFYGATPPASKPVVTGSRGDPGPTGALKRLLDALVSLGLVTDATT